MGGPVWAYRFILGLPILGALGNVELFDTHPCKKKFADKSGDKAKLLAKSPVLFLKRPLAPDPRKRSVSRDGALCQISVGWLDGPFPLSQGGRLVDAPDLSINLFFRFPADQSDKVTAFDDFKNARVNRYFRNAKPIPFSPRGHISILTSHPSERLGDLSFGKSGHPIAYEIGISEFPIYTWDIYRRVARFRRDGMPFGRRPFFRGLRSQWAATIPSVDCLGH